MRAGDRALTELASTDRLHRHAFAAIVTTGTDPESGNASMMSSTKIAPLSRGSVEQSAWAWHVLRQEEILNIAELLP